MSETNLCRGCGICCDLYGTTLSANGDDLARWRHEGRDDLLVRVGEEGRLWAQPDGPDGSGGSWADACPYIVRTGSDTAHCGIHETKPAICRAYPTDLHGRRCMCGVTFAP